MLSAASVLVHEYGILMAVRGQHCGVLRILIVMDTSTGRTASRYF